MQEILLPDGRGFRQIQFVWHTDTLVQIQNNILLIMKIRRNRLHWITSIQFFLYCIVNQPCRKTIITLHCKISSSNILLLKDSAIRHALNLGCNHNYNLSGTSSTSAHQVKLIGLLSFKWPSSYSPTFLFCIEFKCRIKQNAGRYERKWLSFIYLLSINWERKYANIFIGDYFC